MLDGAARLDGLFDACAAAGMSAIAMTDHGNVYGAYDFYKKAAKAGIKPIIGIEAYVAPEHRGLKQPVRWGTPAPARRRRLRRRRLHPHDAARRDHRGHVQPVPAVLAGLARGVLPPAAGWTGSCWPGTPRASSPPPDARAARCRPGSGSASTTRRCEAAADYRDIFGPDNFFVELMGHDLPIEQRCRDGLRRIASDLALPYVVTNDSHYVTPGDAQAHEVLLCVQTGTNMADPKRFKLEGNALLHQEPGRDAGDQRRRRLAGRLRQHAADRRALERGVRQGRT